MLRRIIGRRDVGRRLIEQVRPSLVRRSERLGNAVPILPKRYGTFFRTILKKVHKYMPYFKQESPAKDWVFTIWPMPDQDFEQLVPILNAMPYKYITYQIEVGSMIPDPQNGLIGGAHLQGFVQFEEKVRLTAIRKFFPSPPNNYIGHWDKRRGTPYEAAHYAQKPVPGCDCEKHCRGLDRFDINIEDGWLTAEQQYKVHEITRSIKLSGLSRTIERFPEAYLTLHAGMEKLAGRFTQPRDFQSEVTVIYGEPDAGKTRYAMQGPSPYKLASFSERGSSDFFGDYRPDQHETLVVDDFYSNWKYTTFLHVCDRYPTEVHTKGGFRQFLSRQIVFTSNLPPNEWYPNILSDPYRADSFHRRIHNILFFCKTGYKVMKGHLPWPIQHLRPLTAEDILMNPQIQDWIDLGLRKKSGPPQRPGEAVVERPLGPRQPNNPVLQPFGPETYENFVARRTPNFA